MADPDVWKELEQVTADLKQARIALEGRLNARRYADPAAELASRYAQNAGVLAEVLGLVALHRPDVLYRFLDDFHEHDSSVRAVIDAIEVTLEDEAEWEEFISLHPELG